VHAAPSIAASRRGIPVLNEKPMATSLEDCRAMVRAADESGALLMCLPFDHSSAFLTALDQLTEERIGKFTGAEAALMIPGPPRDNWYYDRSIAHGGAMLDCQVYPVSRLISALGPAQRVAGFVNTLIPKRIVGDGKRVNSDVDDNVTLVVEWESGQQAVIRTLWGTSFARNDTAIYGRKGAVWITSGQVIRHAPHDAPADGEPVEWLGLKDCYRIPISPSTPNESIVDHFVECIKSGTQPRCSGKLQLHVHEILFRGYEAAATGTTQDLTTSFQPWHSRSDSFYDTRGGYL
jgi:predicted dehydrogenase